MVTQDKLPPALALALIETAHDCVFILSREGLFTFLNEAFSTITGYPIAAYLGRSFLSFLHPEDREKAFVAYTQSLAGEKVHLEMRLINHAGVIVYVDAIAVPEQGAGVTTQIFGFVRDISARKEAQGRLERQARFHRELVTLMEASLGQSLSESFYGQLLDCAVRVIPGAQGGSLLLREGERFLFAAAVGFDLTLLQGAFLYEHEIWRDTMGSHPQVIRDTNLVYDSASERMKLLLAARAHETIKASLSIPVLLGGEVVAYFNLDNFEQPEAFEAEAVEMARLIAQQAATLLQRFRLEAALQREREQLAFLAYHDPLTGLPNRRRFDERLEASLRASDAPLAVLFLDLDHFKSINDTYGHNAADRLLQAISQRLRDSLREDDLLARWAGDEFVLLLPRPVSREKAADMAERLIDSLRPPLLLEGQAITLGVSIGIGLREGPDMTADELIRRADVALYQAKTQRNSYCFFEPDTPVSR